MEIADPTRPEFRLHLPASQTHPSPVRASAWGRLGGGHASAAPSAFRYTLSSLHPTSPTLRAGEGWSFP